jgi:hypothetical protein
MNAFAPVHHIPGPTGFRDLKCNDVDRDFPRIEEAYMKYIGCSKWLEDYAKSSGHHKSDSSLDGQDLDEETIESKRKTLKLEHEYEIIVGKNVTKM